MVRPEQRRQWLTVGFVLLLSCVANRQECCGPCGLPPWSVQRHGPEAATRSRWSCYEPGMISRTAAVARWCRPWSLVVFALFVCSGCASSSWGARANNPAHRVGPTGWNPWSHWTLQTEKGAPLDLFLASDEKPKPLLVMLQGSGCRPLFAIGDADAEGRTPRRSSLFHFAKTLRKPGPVHVMAVEKRGVTSFGPLGEEEPECSEAYERGLSKPDRVRDVVAAIEAFAHEPWVTEVLLLGQSEGADLATGVAKALGPGKLAAVGLLSSAGPSQLFDFVVFDRRKRNHEAVLEDFQQTLGLLGPNPPARIHGHSALRWKSYAVDSTPLQDMAGLDVPVFVAHGTDDENSPVESADLFVIELLRMNPSRPVYYFMVPDATHGFVGADGTDHAPNVIARFLEWAVSAKKSTTIVDR